MQLHVGIYSLLSIYGFVGVRSLSKSVSLKISNTMRPMSWNYTSSVSM